MYEQHFGLNKRPFPANATGTNVFVGPQTANTLAALMKGLALQDAVVAVSGPTGSGKTTVVAKALDALSGSHKIVRIGRIHLQGTDALEFLLEELGVAEPPKGPIRQFAALRQQLRQLETENTRLVVVVEDALRAGAETLAELEALTAADAGESGGAAMILMGDERLATFCKDPQLKRLDQRSRQQLTIAPLSAAELRGYLMHCFRLAGANFDLIFDNRCAALVHQLSGGIPRDANNIVEAALTAAAAEGIQKVEATYVVEVARNEFGLEADNFEAAPVIATAAPEPDPAPAQILKAEPAPEPVIVFSDEAPHESPPLMDDIPQLIQDTLPNLEILAPEFETAEVAADPEEIIPELHCETIPGLDNLPDLKDLQPVADSAARPESEPQTVPEPQPAPVLVADPQPRPEPEVLPTLDDVAEDTPEWDRDPTLAELRPDLDALEKAMAFAHGDTDEKPAPEPEARAVSTPPAPKVEDNIDEIPEITLDNAIQARIEDHLIDEPGQVSATSPDPSSASPTDKGVPEVRIAPQKATKADAEIEKIAAELARAKTIEDVDDKLAETLFGEEINLIASQVVAAGAAGEPANDGELALFDTAAANMAQSAGTPHASTVASEEPALEVLLETRERGGEAGLDLSASQRLKTVQALNAVLHPSLHAPENVPPINGTNGSTGPAEAPQPIEDQIDISMTQTLKALNIRPPISDRDGPGALDDDDEPQKNGGFFSRFKRS
ncbi:MAG: hypothetical protein KC572_01150 [Gammaproteobacteria bacterium]|nr:hypothetical protein [Gammaproteobacteria bacterium]